MEHIHTLYNIFQQWPKVSTDTRKEVANTIFFALSGDQFDGNLFADLALEKGARIAVVDDARVVKSDRYFLVDDVLDTLQLLAQHHRLQHPIPLIGITGSNGKTTTKELIAAVLQSEKKICYTKGNLNNHIGLPLSLLEIESDTQIAIIEMGANHRGEIAQLCQIAQPDLGLITNIGKAHLEGFGSLEGVIAAKNELYTHIRNSAGKLFVHADDALLMSLSEHIPRFTYGTVQADLTARLKSAIPGLCVDWWYQGAEYSCETQLYGSYNFPNILAAIAVGAYFGISPQHINEAIKNYLPANSRSQQLQTASNKIILDAYNANPVSMEQAIRSFHACQYTRPWLILGDMFELGAGSQEEHLLITELLIKLGFEKVILVGKEFAGLHGHPFLSFTTTDDTLRYLYNNIIKDAHILIKGSRGMQMEKLLKYL